MPHLSRTQPWKGPLQRASCPLPAHQSLLLPTSGHASLTGSTTSPLQLNLLTPLVPQAAPHPQGSPSLSSHPLCAPDPSQPTAIPHPIPLAFNSHATHPFSDPRWPTRPADWSPQSLYPCSAAAHICPLGLQPSPLSPRDLQHSLAPQPLTSGLHTKRTPKPLQLLPCPTTPAPIPSALQPLVPHPPTHI